MDAGTITLLTGIIACVIGVATFISGMIQRAKSDGEQIANIKQLLTTVNEVKNDIKDIKNTNETFKVAFESNNGRMDLIEKEMSFLKEQVTMLQRRRGTDRKED